MIPIQLEIAEIIARCADAFAGVPAIGGRRHQMHNDPWDNLHAGCESPIERKMLVAIRQFLGYEARAGQFRPSMIPRERRAGAFVFGQQELGHYRVDFLIVGFARGQRSAMIVVECDGAGFHDAHRDDQRDYELSSLGFTTVRFTGSEINRSVWTRLWRITAAMDPYLALAIAAEYKAASAIVDVYQIPKEEDRTLSLEKLQEQLGMDDVYYGFI